MPSAPSSRWYRRCSAYPPHRISAAALKRLQARIADGIADDAEEDADEGDSDSDADDDDVDDTASSATTPKKVAGVWWLASGKCYQGKRPRVDATDGASAFEYKRFRASSETVTALCVAHEAARKWVAREA